jgi:hypothetical protein
MQYNKQGTLNMNELTNCPYCCGDLTIKKVCCNSCNTEICGCFKSNRFQMFSSEDLLFIELFIKNEGNIKLMEKDLGISYPTVKNRLRKIIKTLGYHETESAPSSTTQVLQDLSDGKISINEAMKNLKESE